MAQNLVVLQYGYIKQGGAYSDGGGHQIWSDNIKTLAQIMLDGAFASKHCSGMNSLSADRFKSILSGNQLPMPDAVMYTGYGAGHYIFIIREIYS